MSIPPRKAADTVRNVPIALPATGEEEWQAVRDPLFSGWLTQGPKVAAFEKAFAERHQVGHALATTSCTTALHLALTALGIGPGDEVLVPSFTWVATANAVLYCGATPVFCDVDRTTYNIDVGSAVDKLSPRTRAAIPVHLFGLCADIEGLRDALPSSVKIVEDAACAAGASTNGTPADELGKLQVPQHTKVAARRSAEVKNACRKLDRATSELAREQPAPGYEPPMFALDLVFDLECRIFHESR